MMYFDPRFDLETLTLLVLEEDKLWTSHLEDLFLNSVLLNSGCCIGKFAEFSFMCKFSVP